MNRLIWWLVKWLIAKRPIEKIAQLRKELDTRHPEPRPVVIAAPLRFNKAGRMDALRYAPDHPLWGAVMDEIEILKGTHVLIACDPELTDKRTHVELGIIQGLEEFRQQLQDVMKESRTEMAKEDAANRAR